MNFTYKNHLRYYIGGREFGYRETSEEKFLVKLGQIDHDYYRKNTYQKELLRVADLIYQDYGKNFALFLSGGTDSEIVLRNFLDIGIKPNCFTIKFKNDYNLSDVKDAESLATELGINLNIIDFDVRDFFNGGEAIELGGKIQCTQITYLLVYHAIKKIQLPSIMGGELLLRRNIHTNPSTWYYVFRENEDASAIRFSKIYNIPLVNEYFTYTPEIALYFLENSDVQQLVTTRLNYKLSSYSSKNAILKKLLPDIRVRKKTHGFEKLLGFNYEIYRLLMNNQIDRLESSLDGIEYNEAIQRLRGEYGNC